MLWQGWQGHGDGDMLSMSSSSLLCTFVSNDSCYAWRWRNARLRWAHCFWSWVSASSPSWFVPWIGLRILLPIEGVHLEAKRRELSRGWRETLYNREDNWSSPLLETEQSSECHDTKLVPFDVEIPSIDVWVTFNLPCTICRMPATIPLIPTSWTVPKTTQYLHLWFKFVFVFASAGASQLSKLYVRPPLLKVKGNILIVYRSRFSRIWWLSMYVHQSTYMRPLE